MDRFQSALQTADAAGLQADVTLIRANLAEAWFIRCGIALANGNIGSAREAFGEALASGSGAEDWWRELLVRFFREELQEETAAFFDWALQEVHERGMQEESQLLAPFEAAVHYWQEAKEEQRALVLERLNPEVREIVEAIVLGDEASRSGKEDECLG